MRWTLSFFGLLIGSVALAQEPCVSGVPVGERPGPYSFNLATGPERGQLTCYICETAERPAIIVFARSLSDPLSNLLTSLDKVASPNPDREGIRVWTTMLGEEFPLDTLVDWSKESAIRNIPLGTFDDPIGPPTYRLAEDADVTVLLFVKEKVQANFAFRAGELSPEAIDQILKAVPLIKQ